MNEPEFLKVKPGDNVLVGGERDPDAPTIFFKLQTLIQAKSNLFMVRK